MKLLFRKRVHRRSFSKQEHVTPDPCEESVGSALSLQDQFDIIMIKKNRESFEKNAWKFFEEEATLSTVSSGTKTEIAEDNDDVHPSLSANKYLMMPNYAYHGLPSCCFINPATNSASRSSVVQDLAPRWELPFSFNLCGGRIPEETTTEYVEPNCETIPKPVLHPKSADDIGSLALFDDLSNADETALEPQTRSENCEEREGCEERGYELRSTSSQEEREDVTPNTKRKWRAFPRHLWRRIRSSHSLHANDVEE